MKLSNYRELGILIFDAALVALGIILSLSLIEKNNFIKFLFENRYFYCCVFISNVFILFIFQIHKKVWSYFSIEDIKIFLSACFLCSVFNFAINFYYFRLAVPGSIFLLQNIFVFVMLILSRILYRILPQKKILNRSKDAIPIILIGAGSAAALLMSYLSNGGKWSVVGFLDDDPGKRGRTISGVPVLGPISLLSYFSKKYHVKHALLCMPSVSNEDNRRAFEVASSCPDIQILTVPSFSDLLFKNRSIDSLKKIDISSLLGRKHVSLSNEGLNEFLKDKVIFVSGAGGSIGSELCRQIAKHNPKLIVLFDISEFAIYSIGQYFSHNLPGIPIKLIVGDVKNFKRVNSIFFAYKPNLVFHAAAYKHVPLMEDGNAIEALRNNVDGTINLAEIASNYQVDKFVLVSTDKAVNPTNIMGATKRLAEIACLGIAKTSKTKFATVRFGNVLGSNGSVIPKFQEQINRGGPVTVTHPDIERYFMTIREAVELVLHASLIAYGSEIFILDMGKPVKIVDLAKRMIELSGAAKDQINIIYTGLRPGEKLYEELMLEYEQALATIHNKIRVSKGTNGAFEMSPADIRRWIIQQQECTDEEIKISLNKILPEYIPANT